jgi:hypothetical protein
MKDRIMRDEDKPFVIYRRGSLNFTIVPRGVKGWTQFAVWMVLLVPLLVWFTQYAETHESGLQFAIGMALFFSQSAWRGAFFVCDHSSSITGATRASSAYCSAVPMSAASSRRWPLGSKK